jgi:chromosome segregation ATPase
MRHSFIAVVFTLVSLAAARAADQPNPAEAKLREGLRATMLQLRSVQGEKAALEAAKVDLEGQVAALTDKLEKLEKQSAEEKAAAEKRIAEQTERLVERGNISMKLETDLAQSQKAHKESAALAAKKESERAKLASEKIVLDRKVADQQARNAKMHEVGSEILTRFEKFGLGTAIAAREPFIGLTRVKLQNLIQDFGDKLADQKIKP